MLYWMSFSEEMETTCKIRRTLPGMLLEVLDVISRKGLNGTVSWELYHYY